MVDAPWAYDAYDLYADVFARNGWSWAMWAWKRIDDEAERALYGTTTAWGIYRAPRADAMWSRVDVCRDSEDEIVAKLARGATRYLDPSPELDARFRRAVALP